MIKHKLTVEVEEILRNIPETRNSDITLMIEVWKRFYKNKLKVAKTGQHGVYLEDLYYLPREDTIKRIRAKFNENGQFYPTDWEVAKARGMEEDQWRVAMGYPRKDQVREPTKRDSYMDQTRHFASGQEKLIKH